MAGDPVEYRRQPLSLHKPRPRPPVRTTMIYTHVLDRGPLGVRSPIDRL